MRVGGTASKSTCKERRESGEQLTSAIEKQSAGPRDVVGHLVD